VKRFGVLSLVLATALLMSGCFWNDDVPSSSVGIISDGGALRNQCLPPGVYSDGSFFAQLKEVPIGAITFEVADESVATADTQLVGITVAVQIQREGNCDAIRNILTNWPLLVDDKALEDTATSQVAQAIKVGARKFTLTQLLDDRTGLATGIQQDLQVVATKFSVSVLNVSIKDIKLDPTYEALLQQKAQIQVNIDIAHRRQDQVTAEQETARIEQEQRAQTLAAQLTAEQAQTSVQVEIARRQGEVTAAQNKVYSDNPQAFELARLQAMKDIVGKGTVWFVPLGTDLSLILNQSGVPVVPLNPTSAVTATAPITPTNPISTTTVVTP
jgi:hypothetical protein